jgi:hypothetical protein
MDPDYAEIKSDDRVVAQFLRNYHRNWQRHFPDLIKRAHWHTIIQARLAGPEQGVSCRSLHRVLYGAYGTDIRTCIERIKECESEGFLRVVNPSQQDCTASASCFFLPTEKLRECFDRHCYETIAEVYAVFGDHPGEGAHTIASSDDAAAAIFTFLGGYDQKWREAADFVVRRKGLTIAHVDDAMNHLVTYQYWAIAMLLWATSAFAQSEDTTSALVVDEIISKMWEALRLGHLAIKERVDNLIRWGFLDESTIKKRKAVSLSADAAEAMSRSLTETMPQLRELYRKLLSDQVEATAAQTA